MSSRSFSPIRAFPERLLAPARRWARAWIRRRGPVHPPLTLGYRQIYILPTRFGWGVGLLLTAMLLGSLNFNNNLGLLTTFLVAGLGVLSMHAAHRNMDGVRVAACDAGPVFAGNPLKLRITLQDTLGRARAGLVPECRGCDPAPGCTLSPYDRNDTELRFDTDRRGWIELPRIRLRTRYPLGWFEAWSWFWPAHGFLVWPAPAASAPPLAAAARAEYSDHPGDESDEFHGLRGWREGDPLHRIAWKASQRHQTLLARQFTRPDRQRVELRLADAPGPDREARISVLARWVLEAERAELEYAMDLGSTRIEAGSGDVQRIRCLDALAELP